MQSCSRAAQPTAEAKLYIEEAKRQRAEDEEKSVRVRAARCDAMVCEETGSARLSSRPPYRRGPTPPPRRPDATQRRKSQGRSSSFSPALPCSSSSSSSLYSSASSCFFSFFFLFLFFLLFFFFFFVFSAVASSSLSGKPCKLGAHYCAARKRGLSAVLCSACSFCCIALLWYSLGCGLQILFVLLLLFAPMQCVRLPWYWARLFFCGAPLSFFSSYFLFFSFALSCFPAFYSFWLRSFACSFCSFCSFCSLWLGLAWLGSPTKPIFRGPPSLLLCFSGSHSRFC